MTSHHRNLKVSLSVGGWTYSQAGHFNFVTDATKRATFVSSALKLIEDYGFDGIDLDFEYPSNTALGQGFADLLTSLRSGLDSYASSKGDSVPYLLTVRRDHFVILCTGANVFVCRPRFLLVQPTTPTLSFLK